MRCMNCIVINAYQWLTLVIHIFFTSCLIIEEKVRQGQRDNCRRWFAGCHHVLSVVVQVLLRELYGGRRVKQPRTTAASDVVRCNVNDGLLTAGVWSCACTVSWRHQWRNDAAYCIISELKQSIQSHTLTVFSHSQILLPIIRSFLFWFIFLYFYSAAALLGMLAKQSAVIPTAIPCLSVRLSHAGTLSRWMKIGSCGLRCEVAKTL